MATETSRFVALYSCNCWKVLDTQTGKPASASYHVSAQAFVHALALEFNNGNRHVMARFQLGNTDWLDGFDTLYYSKELGKKGLL